MMTDLEHLARRGMGAYPFNTEPPPPRAWDNFGMWMAGAMASGAVIFFALGIVWAIGGT